MTPSAPSLSGDWYPALFLSLEGLAFADDLRIHDFTKGEHDVCAKDATLVVRIDQKSECQNRRTSHDIYNFGCVCWLFVVCLGVMSVAC